MDQYHLNQVGHLRSHGSPIIGSSHRQVPISYLPQLITAGRNLMETFDPRLPITDGKVIALATLQVSRRSFASLPV